MRGSTFREVTAFHLATDEAARHPEFLESAVTSTIAFHALFRRADKLTQRDLLWDALAADLQRDLLRRGRAVRP